MTYITNSFYWNAAAEKTVARAHGGSSKHIFLLAIEAAAGEKLARRSKTK